MAALGVGLEGGVAIRAEQHALGQRLGDGRAIDVLGHRVEHVDGQVRLPVRGPGQGGGRLAVGRHRGVCGPAEPQRHHHLAVGPGHHARLARLALEPLRPQELPVEDVGDLAGIESLGEHADAHRVDRGAPFRVARHVGGESACELDGDGHALNTTGGGGTGVARPKCQSGTSYCTDARSATMGVTRSRMSAWWSGWSRYVRNASCEAKSATTT